MSEGVGMFTRMCLVVSLCFGFSTLAAEKVRKVKLADVLLHVSAKASQVKQLKDFGRLLNLSEQTKSEYLIFLKSKKLELAGASNLNVNGATLVLEDANVQILLSDISKGFVEVNKKSIQVVKGESLEERYAKFLAALSHKSFIRSIFFEQAFAADSVQAAATQTMILVESVSHLIELCISGNKRSDGSIAICPLARDSFALNDLYADEFPIDLKCRDGKPDYLKTDKRRLSFFSGSNAYGEAKESVKEAGKEVCVARDYMSYRSQDNVSIAQGMSASQCLSLLKFANSCCGDEDQCLNSLGLLIDETKTKDLYDKKFAPKGGTPGRQWDKGSGKQ